MPTWPVAAGSLVLGFAVAAASGVRPLGGVVLAVASAWCAWRWWRQTGLAVAVVLLVVYASAFAASHAIADVIGTWPAVLLVAAAAGTAAWALADRRGPRPAAA